MERRVPILYVTDGGGIGGAEQRLLALAERLDRRFEPSLVTLGPRGPLHERMEGLGIGAHALDVIRRHQHVLAVPRIAARAVSSGARLVHGQIRYGGLAGCLAARLARVPAVVTRTYTRRLGGWEAVDRATARISGTLVAVSEAAARVLVEADGAPPSKVLVIPNGVDVERIERTPRSDDPLFGDRVIISVGNLHAIKGHRFLVQAMPEILRGEPSARLALVGAGGLEDELRALARDLRISERVSFLGYRADPVPLLRAAELFVLPSLNEGMSHALLEAMAAGLAVVATRAGGNVETVGDAGVLVPPGDARSIAEAVLELLAERDRARELGMVARTRVRERYSVDAMVAGYASLYDRILAAELFAA